MDVCFLKIIFRYEKITREKTYFSVQQQHSKKCVSFPAARFWICRLHLFVHFFFFLEEDGSDS